MNFNKIAMHKSILFVLLFIKLIHAYDASSGLDHKCTSCWFKAPLCHSPYKNTDCVIQNCIISSCINTMKSMNCCKNKESYITCQTSLGCKFDNITNICIDAFTKAELENCDNRHTSTTCGTNCIITGIIFFMIFISIVICYISYCIYNNMRNNGYVTMEYDMNYNRRHIVNNYGI